MSQSSIGRAQKVLNQARFFSDLEEVPFMRRLGLLVAFAGVLVAGACSDSSGPPAAVKSAYKIDLRSSVGRRPRRNSCCSPMPRHGSNRLSLALRHWSTPPALI